MVDLRASVVKLHRARTNVGPEIIQQSAVAGQPKPDYVRRVETQNTILVKNPRRDGGDPVGLRGFIQRKLHRLAPRAV